MYDRETAALIESAPALAGLDRRSLPEWLTRAYARLASVRLRLTEGRIPTQLIADEMEVVARIASTYESMAATLDDAAMRRPAAFVAATSHYLMLRTDQVLQPAEVERQHLS